jgi:cell division septal protein FtsQ
MSPTTTRTRPATGTPPRNRAPIDPRIKARRAAVRRDQGRRRARLIYALGVVTVLVIGGWFALHSALFSARAVTVVGATHETTAQIEAVSGLAQHPALIDFHAGSAAASIEQLPWVRTATVRVHWPDGVRITVTEQVPQLVMATAGGKWAILSSDGRVLADASSQPAGLILVTGPSAPGPPGSTLGGSDQSGLVVASTLPASFRAQVSVVHVEPGNWVQLAMTTPIVVDLGTTSQLEAKYEDVASLLAGATLHDGDVLDVSVPDAPTVTGG